MIKNATSGDYFNSLRDRSKNDWFNYLLVYQGLYSLYRILLQRFLVQRWVICLIFCEPFCSSCRHLLGCCFSFEGRVRWHDSLWARTWILPSSFRLSKYICKCLGVFVYFTTVLFIIARKKKEGYFFHGLTVFTSACNPRPAKGHHAFD